MFFLLPGVAWMLPSLVKKIITSRHGSFVGKNCEKKLDRSSYTP